jgi:hypothetical protein
MAQIPIMNGVFADAVADFRTSYPRNMIPVPKATGIANGYLRPADGIELFATGPGTDRGGFNWDGVMHRVMGTKLCRVSSAGAVTVLGDVGPGGTVTIDNGFGYLSIWSGGRLYYWDGATLTQVTDPDLGTVIDGRWIAGYNLSTDGTSLIVTELADKTQVNPLKYGSAESDPDPILAVDELRNEAYALGRFTIEVFENVGGDGFPFRRIEGAQVPRGVIGTHAYSQFAQTFAFIGSARNEAPAVYIMGAGTADKISTREIDQILLRYTEAQLALAVVETKVDKGHNWLMLHLPDTCWVYDLSASLEVKEPVWFELNSAITGLATYRARGLVWCYERWVSGDPTTSNLGAFTDARGDHYGAIIGWDFGTLMVYADGREAIVHELELVALPGRVAFGSDPVVWTSYSDDGETWSQERPTAAGRQGQRAKRIAWRRLGRVRHYRVQRFRGTSDCHVSFARLEAQFEGLSNGRP